MTTLSERTSKKLTSRSFVRQIRLSMHTHTHMEGETLTKENHNALYLEAANAAEKGDITRLEQLSSIGIKLDRAVKLADGRMRSPIQLARAAGHTAAVAFIVESRKA